MSLDNTPSASVAVTRPLTSSAKALDGTTAFNLARAGRFKTPITGLSIEPPPSIPLAYFANTSPPSSRPSSSRFDRFRDSPRTGTSPKRGASRHAVATAVDEDASHAKTEVIGLAATRNNALTLVTNFNPSWADPFELMAQARIS